MYFAYCHKAVGCLIVNGLPNAPLRSWALVWCLADINWKLRFIGGSLGSKGEWTCRAKGVSYVNTNPERSKFFMGFGNVAFIQCFLQWRNVWQRQFLPVNETCMTVLKGFQRTSANPTVSLCCSACLIDADLGFLHINNSFCHLV